MSFARQLDDVPEEDSTPTTPEVEVAYLASPVIAASSSASTITGAGNSASGSASISSKRAPSLRSLGRASDAESISGSGRKASSRRSASSRTVPIASYDIRTLPTLPQDKRAVDVPAVGMYWSIAPVYGTVPQNIMRSHSMTLVDNTIWMIGAYEEKNQPKDARGSKSLYCFDVDTMQWTMRETIGDSPPPSRAHTATLIDRKIVVIGGGFNSTYYDTVYVFDTVTRQWSRPRIRGTSPCRRRSHTAVFHGRHIYIFGGGTGMTALNDVWALDVSRFDEMGWEEVKTTGKAPAGRGYHSANLIGNVMVVIGGSDGNNIFNDVWLLDLTTMIWTMVDHNHKNDPDQLHSRIAHTSTQVGSFLFIAGGYDSGTYFSDLLVFDLITLQFDQKPLYGKPFSNRAYHAAVLADSRLFIFGGTDGLTTLDDVHILDLAGGAYLPQVTSFTIDPRAASGELEY